MKINIFAFVVVVVVVFLSSILTCYAAPWLLLLPSLSLLLLYCHFFFALSHLSLFAPSHSRSSLSLTCVFISFIIKLSKKNKAHL